MSQVVGKVETTLSTAKFDAISAMSDQLLAGVRNWQTNVAPAVPGNPAWNWVFAQYQSSGPDMGMVDTPGATYRPNDDDGNYGNSHALHGLALRALRDPSADTFNALEACVNYAVQAEALAVQTYGSTFSGSFIYWIAAGYTVTDKDNAGNSMTISPGQPRKMFSIDQMHMAAHAAYIYFKVAARYPDSLFPSKAAFLDLIRRAVVREKTAPVSGEAPSTFGTVPSSFIFGNLLYAITNGAEGGQSNNGITATSANTAVSGTLSDPFLGSEYAPWKVAGGDNRKSNASSNVTLDSWIRGVLSPDSTQDGIIKYLGGMCHDMLTLDLSRQNVTYLSNNATYGTFGTVYPWGWSTMAGVNGQLNRWTSGATPPDHLEIGATGTRDSMIGRTPQRAAVLALAAMYNPNLMIHLDESGRQINVLDACEDMLHASALYLLDHRSGMVRECYPGYLGKSGVWTPQLVEPTFTGYALMAIELYLLAKKKKAGTFDPATLYRWSGVSA